jgi:hypothetical protein
MPVELIIFLYFKQLQIILFRYSKLLENLWHIHHRTSHEKLLAAENRTLFCFILALISNAYRPSLRHNQRTLQTLLHVYR